MREILFRGKTENGRWAYGSLILAGSYCCILESEENVHPMDYLYLDKDLGTIDGKATPVIPETVGQYTGLKDKNDKKIFEGDILQKHSPYMVRAKLLADGTIEATRKKEVISIGNNGISFTYSRSGSYYTDPIDDNEYGEDIEDYEIIGNIHDNPELLKGETK